MRTRIQSTLLQYQADHKNLLRPKNERSESQTLLQKLLIRLTYRDLVAFSSHTYYKFHCVRDFTKAIYDPSKKYWRYRPGAFLVIYSCKGVDILMYALLLVIKLLIFEVKPIKMGLRWLLIRIVVFYEFYIHFQFISVNDANFEWLNTEGS